MRVPGRKFFRRAMRPLARRLFPGAVVLGYHRIGELGWDPLQLAVSPKHFSAQLAALKSLRTVISLAELAARHAAGEKLEQYAVVTFDDGYVDFAEAALPIAAQADAPITVFVATGFTGRSFWWEEIAALLAGQPRSSTSLLLRLPGGEAVEFGELDRPEARAAAARTICNRLACRSHAEIGPVLDQLRIVSAGSTPVSGRPMQREELAAAARHPCAEIGAHTTSHGCLAQLSPAAQRAEIDANKRDLEEICKVAVQVFSYPNGSLSASTPGLVAALGFSCACMSMDGAFSARDDVYRIPRLWAPDVDAPEFRRWLGNWVAGAH
jgi:peptidoglycan/xylan/chitin deacetylase (PgdA/CDA1 family)